MSFLEFVEFIVSQLFEFFIELPVLEFQFIPVLVVVKLVKPQQFLEQPIKQ
uniref:Uncharacterized protein n=1 Tax=viral metagenome TaxID=1070528 RepID=A0A6M3K5X7_9ZZZZ